MNTYTLMKRTHQKQVDDYLSKCSFFAFNEKQFREGLQKLGIAEDQTGVLVRLGDTGGYILKEKAPGFKELMDKLDREKQDALQDPENGYQFAYSMFYTELANHEYSWTGDTWETLDALGITEEDLNRAPMLQKALEKAKQDVMRAEE